jgi:hypothetical protein
VTAKTGTALPKTAKFSSSSLSGMLPVWLANVYGIKGICYPNMGRHVITKYLVQLLIFELPGQQVVKS